MQIQCKLCNKIYNDEGNFGQHVKRKHGLTIWDYREQYEGFEIPKCPFCGKKCYSHGKKFNATCGDPDCSRKQREQTNLALYGAKATSQNEVVKEKARQTNLKRYGVEWTSQDKAVRKKQIETCLERYGVACNLSLEENKEKVKATNLLRYGVSNPAQSPEVQEKMKQTNLSRRGCEYTWLSKEVREKAKATVRQRFGVDNVLQSKEVQLRGAQTRLERYGVEYPSQSEFFKEKIRKTCLLKYGTEHASQNPAIHKRQMSHKRARAEGFDSLSEKKLAEMFTNRGVPFKLHYVVNGKEWDFALFKDGQLKCLVEVDGEYNHGLLSDSDGKLVHGEKDCERFHLVPDGVNFIAVDSLRITEENVGKILECVGIDYESFIQEILSSLPEEFPYPSYTQERMLKDWKRLRSYSSSPRQRLCQSIVHNFHRSIWSGRVGNKPSPVEAWADKTLLEKCVRNRFIYKSNLSSRNIADGFNVCKLAPKVSVFQPALAKYLLAKYAKDAHSVIDPFSGFSGRMLGACALGMSYTGYDLSPKAVEESNEIVRFLGLNATVQCADLFSNSGSADVLLTCPPYGIKETWGQEIKDLTCEEWIDECLVRFNCKQYIFVTDVLSEKYGKDLCETIRNKSHFSESHEYIYCIRRE